MGRVEEIIFYVITAIWLAVSVWLALSKDGNKGGRRDDRLS